MYLGVDTWLLNVTNLEGLYYPLCQLTSSLIRVWNMESLNHRDFVIPANICREVLDLCG